MNKALLEVRGLTKSFGALLASDDVNLEVREGETHAIIGPNGAGKTTLISQLAGNLRPDRGRVRFAGEDITALSAPAREETALSSPARAILEEVGLSGRCEVPAANLAHGEQRALEIATALATRPRLLLLDEPVAGMGAEETQRMIALLSSLKGGKTLILVEHDMDAVFSLADRISVLVYGRIIATGAPEEIRANLEVRRAYLGEEIAA